MRHDLRVTRPFCLHILGEEIILIRDELGKKKGLKVPKWEKNKSCKSKKDNDQKKKDKMTNNDLQNITKKNKDGATRTQ
jgi:hypothetical protein